VRSDSVAEHPACASRSNGPFQATSKQICSLLCHATHTTPGMTVSQNDEPCPYHVTLTRTKKERTQKKAPTIAQCLTYWPARPRWTGNTIGYHLHAASRLLVASAAVCALCPTVPSRSHCNPHFEPCVSCPPRQRRRMCLPQPLFLSPSGMRIN